MSIELAYQVLLAATLGVLTLLALACLIRCILGPRISDRVLAINMIGTLTVIMVAVTVVLLGEGYLADIALIYAMLSFLAVVLLSKVYTGIYQEHKHEESILAGQAADEKKEADA
ncbi:MAG: monovalent cation/H+ antiporter complex subunit F [Candidatus Ventricola sp.]